jgi:SAM-dependent methyltransferase
VADDWQNPEFVELYNTRFAFGEAEIENFLAPLQLGPDDVFLDIGCGDGSVVKKAAERVRLACGLDSSQPQLERARVNTAHLTNVELTAGDFLTLPFPGKRFTRGVSRKALHHLTDPEKLDFTRRLGDLFAPEGLFLIEDAIFDFPAARLPEEMPRLLAEAEQYYGPRWAGIRANFLVTITEEYPTGLDHWTTCLQAGGFTIVNEQRRTCFYSTLIARKEKPCKK